MIMYLVAHAPRKPPGPENLFREEDNQRDSSITRDQTQLLLCDIAPGMQTHGRQLPGGLHATIKGK
jgi:hypothetical protein